MKNLISRCNSVFSTAIITLWCCFAQADDTEVYVGSASGVKPLAIMLLDTSGSMFETVVVNESDDYDHSKDYADEYKTTSNGTAINYQFNKDLNYFSEYNYYTKDLTSNDINDLKKRPFHKDALKCEAASNNNRFTKTGYFNTEFKRWNASNTVWEPSLDIINDNWEWVWWQGWVRVQTIEKPDMPEGNQSSGAFIDCRADDAPGKYINTNPNNSNLYLSNIHSGTYSNAWGNHFDYIYSGNFLNYKIYSYYNKRDLKKTRMQLTQEAAKHVVNTMARIRLGLARFSEDGAGGFIDVAVDDIENIGTDFNNRVDSYIPWGGTPISESYIEVASYLRGNWNDSEKDPLKGQVYFGQQPTEKRKYSNRTINYDYSSAQNYYYGNRNNVYSSRTSSVSTSRSGNTYVSPITSSCQRTSNIVLFTDGSPSADDQSNAKIIKLLKAEDIDFKTDTRITDEDRKVLTNDCDNDDLGIGAGKGVGTCAEEFAFFLANYDQSPLNGIQTFNTHVIGGFFDETSTDPVTVRTLKYMKDIAKYGNGDYASANNKKELIDAFQGAVANVSDNPVTFVAPAVSVNSYNSLEHLDNLYYAMFSPSAENNWKGNLKSYRLSPDGKVVDALGDPAIDYSSGLFKSTSRSYWTPEGTTDGDSVIKGGAARNLLKDNNIFTHLTSNKGPLTTTITSSLDKSLFSLDPNLSIIDQSEIIDWLNRRNPDGSSRQQMEDPLHSRPIVVNYGYTEDPTTKRIIPNGVVFVGTNSGYLHAFKADKEEFKEYFSFVPKELLKNANLYRTADKDQPKAYGVDGPINYWHVDANQNLQVDNGEKVYLFFGLRRGGRHYYALDITDPEKPKFQWQISGGQGGAFEKLGQSWSQMSLAKVRWGNAGKTKVVLLVGGGYDPDEDNRTTRASHSMGNSIYMIDPVTGKLLWSASNNGAATNLPNMTSAITSEIKAVDFDGDQITDYFFVSDLGGRVWRFDINSNNGEDISKTNFIAGAGVIFDANKNNPNYQRFYYAPSVSYFSDPKTKEEFLTIAIGSGFRAHPLEGSTKDSFYVIKDTNITKAPTGYKYTTLNPSDFADIPYGNQLSSTVTTRGWKYDLKVGEKILASPLTSNGNMYFTTFSPNFSASNFDSCSADIGYSLSYSVDFMGDDDPDKDPVSPLITSTAMPNIGIPPQVIELNTTDTGQKLFCELNPEHESCQPKKCEETNSCPDECENTGTVILSGTHVIDGGTLRCDLLKKNYWRSL